MIQGKRPPDVLYQYRAHNDDIIRRGGDSRAKTYHDCVVLQHYLSHSSYLSRTIALQF
jgi:hypothetical protein